jgi:hypothetical protein
MIDLDDEPAPAASAAASATASAAPPATVAPVDVPHPLSVAHQAPSSPTEVAPVFGSVFVSTSGGPANVLVGGSSMGRTPTLLTLPLGHRSLTLVPVNGGAPKDVEVDIGSNGTVMLNIAFPAHAAPPSSAVPSPAPFPAVDMPAPIPPL